MAICPAPIGLETFPLGGAPAAARRSSTTRWRSLDTPSPPQPTGKCTHASPASDWARRKATGSVAAGGFA